ncbi:MAG TPA: hypothetical protein VKT82_15360 [Ktedonobacterales bacterium]|nr:hypothetical protein [Ktedonobacterales bacterium]
MRWTERDLAALRWIGEQYAIHLDHLAHLLGRSRAAPTKTTGQLGSETVRKLVQRWKQAGLVERAWLVPTESSWVWLTRKGLEQLELDYRFWEPKVQGLPHLAAVNQARLWVEHQQPDAIWHSERQLSLGRPFTRSRTRLEHRPDAEIEMGLHRVAIEVERSAKTPQRLPAILYGLARRYDGVWYFCSPTTQGQLQRAIAELNPPTIRQKFSLVPLSLQPQRVRPANRTPLHAEQA